MSQIELLKESLLQLFSLLSGLSSLQYRTLACFVHCEEDILAQPLPKLIESIGNDQLKELVAVSQIPSKEIGVRKQEASHDDVRQLSNEIISSFGALFRLTVLQELFKECLTVEHLMVLFDQIPRVFPDQQLVVLQQLQQLFHGMSDWDVANLHARVQEADAESLQEVIPLPQDMCMLFRPLKGLFQLPLDQVVHFHQRFPKFPPLQLVQLVRLMQLQPMEILELRQLLTSGWQGLQSLVEDFHLEPMEVMDDGNAELDETPQYQLNIIEQPPQQTVYKRNLKPNPELILYGEDDRGSLREGECLVVVPVLYRCDTQEAMPKRLHGDDPLEVCVGSSVQFRRLKVQVTSHQTNESLFFIRFELRKVLSGNAKGEHQLLAFVKSNPILVVSHSTLIKAPTNILPTIEEVIPCEGTPAGGSRVVIIGSNFMETPAARVAFDGIAVQPEYHGPGTLLCHTPPHAPAVVAVNTSNDGKRWSTTNAPFRFGEEEGSPGPAGTTLVASEGPGGDLDIDMMSNIFGGNAQAVELALTGQGAHLGSGALDQMGFHAMHYATACCSDSPERLLSMLTVLIRGGATFAVRDRKGNTPLHWLLLFGSKESIRLVLQRCPAHICALPNSEGVTLCHIAAALDMVDTLKLLLAKGMSPSVRTLEGLTPLHCAVATASHSTFGLLLRFGHGLLCATDAEGDTPLHFAVRENHTAMIEKLLTVGAPVNARNTSGESPLLFACDIGNEKAAQVLLRASVRGSLRLDLCDLTGSTALIAALSSGMTAIAEEILAYRCDNDCKAVEESHGERSQREFSSSSVLAHINVSDCLGRTALSLAAEQEATGLLSKLRASGAVDGKANANGTGMKRAVSSGFASFAPSGGSAALNGPEFFLSPVVTQSTVCV